MSPDPEHHVTTIHRGGLVLREHRLSVPLCHAAQQATAAPWCGCQPGDQRQIRIFAREIVRAEHAADDTRPALVYFQGGPGFQADRPELVGGWIERALEDYRVILLDQRGTGLSSAISATALPGGSTAERADYLVHFRADSIIADAELLRTALLDNRPWTAMGQSFGGFCTLSYLSLAPEGLEAAIITAGLPSLDGTADNVYRATFAQTARRQEEFLRTFPEDGLRLGLIADHLAHHEVSLPSGEVLTVERFLSLGILLGSASGFPRLHHILEYAIPEPREATLPLPLGAGFLTAVESTLSFAANPLYAVLHESIYAQGEATRWAADRVRAQLPEHNAGGVQLTGEMIFPGHFRSDPALQPLAEVAEELAQREGWPALYRPEVLINNTVPAAAAVYTDDMFVPMAISLETAERVRGLALLITNDYQHDGLRQDGAYLFDRLQAKTRGH